VIRHGVDGYLTAYDDLDGAAAHLERLIRDADLRRHVGQAAHERAKAFDLDAYSRQLAGVLGRVLGESPQHDGAPRCASST
jgi:glycosyltransferase involved in cell wall biosynthesis